jgi:hypothetical protein
VFVSMFLEVLAVILLSGTLSPTPKSSLENQGLQFVWPVPFVLYGVGDPTRNLRSRQHSPPERQTSSHQTDTEKIILVLLITNISYQCEN